MKLAEPIPPNELLLKIRNMVMFGSTNTSWNGHCTSWNGHCQVTRDCIDLVANANKQLDALWNA